MVDELCWEGTFVNLFRLKKMEFTAGDLLALFEELDRRGYREDARLNGEMVPMIFKIRLEGKADVEALTQVARLVGKSFGHPAEKYLLYLRDKSREIEQRLQEQDKVSLFGKVQFDLKYFRALRQSQ
jgi:hypothetical protein